jgi:peptidyl-prolyl cis-trans isomerase C
MQKKIIQLLTEKGDFSGLARTSSIDNSKKDGGYFGWIHDGQLLPPLNEAMKQLERGMFTKSPVKTMFGWYVILLHDKRQRPQPIVLKIVEQKREQLKALFRNEKNKGIFPDRLNQYFNELR